MIYLGLIIEGEMFFFLSGAPSSVSIPNANAKTEFENRRRQSQAEDA